ncbi:MAG: radical SAM protein [Candidatus Margulisbacteria bacterium]|jgi:radical SAM protein with 4Fe4S-binding SPASM domain|nr:radical SAM protein [Candidatus Margulisiibacteriota bacterium]
MGIVIAEKPIIEKHQPDCAVWELTLLCNFKCLHCGGSAGLSRKNELTFAEMTKVAEDLKKIEFQRVSLIGGETFLRKDWYEIAKMIVDTGLGITYVTNGSLFPNNEKLVKQVIDTKPSVIGFSLDGGKAETHDYIRGYKGAFAKLWQSLALFDDEGLSLSVITAVNKFNVKELPLIRDLILGKGIAWQIQICSNNGKRFDKNYFLSKDEYLYVAKFIHQSVKEYTTDELPIAGADDLGYFSEKYPFCTINYNCWDGCKAGRSNLGIQSNGNIKGCDSLPDEYIEGNVRERSLYDIWTDPKSFAYTRNFDKSRLKGCCAKCRYGVVCKGGCVDIAHSISGHAFENSYCLYANENNLG